MKLIIQIPCYNEADTLPSVLADIPRHIEGIDEIEVLVIDDGSKDGTAEIARAHGATHVVSHRGNRGLATTFLTGLEKSLELGADVIVNTDGDHQYPGSSIADLVRPIVAGEAELVIGDRQTHLDPKVKAQKRFFYGVGNFVVRTTTGVSVHDAPSGFRAMSRELAMRVFLTNPFSYTIETIFAAGEQRHLVREVPITSNAATRPSRLFKGFAQYIGRSASIIVQGYSMHNPLKAFGWLSAPFLGLGVVLGLRFVFFFIRDPDYSGHIQSLILAAICILVGVQILLFGMLGSLVRANRLLLQDVRMRVRRLELQPGGVAQPKPAQPNLGQTQPRPKTPVT